MTPDLTSYDSIIVAISGGKDGLACLFALLEVGAPTDRLELWHHEVDGQGPSFMDWPSTSPYVSALARDFRLPLYRSWREGGFEREMLRKDAPAVSPGLCQPDDTLVPRCHQDRRRRPRPTWPGPLPEPPHPVRNGRACRRKLKPCPLCRF